MNQNEQQLSSDERQVLAREIAIDRCGYRVYGTRAFTDGWDAALGYIKERQVKFMEAASDGRYCRHHDDDPAHSAICYQQGL